VFKDGSTITCCVAGGREPHFPAGMLSRAATTAAATWRVHGGLPAAALGAVRGKKWKPFHNMHRANKLREIRRGEEAEARDQAAAMAEAAATGAPIEHLQAKDEPRVATSPFQAARIMRAFDVYSDDDAFINFWTRLNVDLSRESVRGTCHLPHGLATKVRVLAFCPDDEAEAMLAAGADFAGITDPVRRINQGWLGFDRCLATPSIMPQVMKIAKVLGPRKMMPNPKSGTVVANLKQAIQESKGGTLLEYRAEGDGELRCAVGSPGFSDAQVLDNMKFLVQTLLRARPRGASSAAVSKTPASPLIPGTGGGSGSAEEAKDAYFLEATMQLGDQGPPIRIDPEAMMPSSVGYFR